MNLFFGSIHPKKKMTETASCATRNGAVSRHFWMDMDISSTTENCPGSYRQTNKTVS
jgi:hypothetical protein